MVECSDHQETDIDTGLISSLQNHSTGRNVPSEAETQSVSECDFDRTRNPEVTEQAAVGERLNSVNAKETCAASQGTVGERDSNEMTEQENPAKENSCDESGNPTDIQTHSVYCEPGAGLDFVSVIDYDTDTETPVCVVDVVVSPFQ